MWHKVALKQTNNANKPHITRSQGYLNGKIFSSSSKKKTKNKTCRRSVLHHRVIYHWGAPRNIRSVQHCSGKTTHHVLQGDEGPINPFKSKRPRLKIHKDASVSFFFFNASGLSRARRIHYTAWAHFFSSIKDLHQMCEPRLLEAAGQKSFRGFLSPTFFRSS